MMLTSIPGYLKLCLFITVKNIPQILMLIGTTNNYYDEPKITASTHIFPLKLVPSFNHLAVKVITVPDIE